MEIGDLVHILENEALSLAHVKGERGFIEYFSEDGSRAQLVLLAPDGTMRASGAHPVRLLAPESGYEWVRAKHLYFEKAKELERELRARTESWLAHLKLVAEEFGLSKETVEACYNRCQDWVGHRY